MNRGLTVRINMYREIGEIFKKVVDVRRHRRRHNNVALSAHYCCNGKGTVLSVCIVELYVIANNKTYSVLQNSAVTAIL